MSSELPLSSAKRKEYELYEIKHNQTWLCLPNTDYPKLLFDEEFVFSIRGESVNFGIVEYPVDYPETEKAKRRKVSEKEFYEEMLLYERMLQYNKLMFYTRDCDYRLKKELP